MKLSNRFRRGVKWSGIAAVITSVMQFLLLLLLARLIDKGDFGRLAAASLFFQISLQIQDFAINNTILHRQEEDPKQLSALFWANLFLGIFLFSTLWSIGGAISWWYGDSELKSVVSQFALLMPFMGAAATFKVLHQKRMDYKHIGSVEMLAALASVALTLILALQGHGLQALVWGIMARYLLEALLYLSWKPQFRPAFSFQFKGGNIYWRLGLAQTGERIITLLTSQMDTLLIGKLLGMEALGIYDVIRRLLIRPSNLLNNIIERVALPLYARLQYRKLVLKRVFNLLLKRIATFHFFGYGMFIIMANFLVPFFLGKEWAEHVTLFRLVAGFVFLHCLLNPVDSLLVALGKIDKWLWANLLFLPLITVSITFGCQVSLKWAVMAQIAAFCIFLVMVYAFILGKLLELKWREYLYLLWQSWWVTAPSLVFMAAIWYMELPIYIVIPAIMVSLVMFFRLSKTEGMISDLMK